MSKTTVTRLFIGGVIAAMAGFVLGLAALWAAFAGGVVTIGGPTVVALNGGSAAWTVLLLVILGAVAITGGGIVVLISWIGALLNTAQLEDKTWFLLLLVLGLLSFGFVAMIAYVVAGPDGTRQAVPRPQMATALES